MIILHFPKYNHLPEWELKLRNLTPLEGLWITGERSQLSVPTFAAAGAISSPSPIPLLPLLCPFLFSFALPSPSPPPFAPPFFLQAQPVIAQACQNQVFPEIINLERWLGPSLSVSSHKSFLLNTFSFQTQSCIFSNGVPILKQVKNNG